ncbi:MAG: alpha/beta hydrolase [Sandaracinaceae bacterium]|nr:alpha/beta hydrolase [Sandaracinaceae bacterium]
MDELLLEVDGRAVEVAHRAGLGPVILLVHGAGGCAAVWAPVAAHLGGFEVLAPSLPGRGRSAGDAFDDATAAGAWLARAIAALDRGPPILVGHSYGGAVALEAALAGAPLAGLALVATGARLRVHPSVLAAAARAAEGGSPMSTSFAFYDAPRAAIEGYERAAGATPPSATRADWIACDRFDRLGDPGALARLGTPALVLGGAADPLTPPKYHERLAGALGRAQLVIVPGRGHMLPWEDPARFAREVRAWAAAL